MCWLVVTEFPVYQSQEIKALEILPGAHYPDYPDKGDLSKLSSRLTVARVEPHFGSSQIIRLADEDRLQVVKLTHAEGQYLKVEVIDIMEGKRRNDLCISRLMPLIRIKVFALK